MQDGFDAFDEEYEMQSSSTVLAVVIGYTENTKGATKVYNTLLMTVEKEGEDVKVDVMEAQGKGESRLTETDPRRLHKIGTVLELQRVEGELVDKKGVLLEIEREHNVDDEMLRRERPDYKKPDKKKGLIYAATTEEREVFDTAVQMLSGKRGLRRQQRLKFKTEDPVDWMVMEDIDRKSLTVRAVAMTNTYYPRDLDVDARLVSLVSSAAGEVPEVIGLYRPGEDKAEVVGVVFAVDGMPIYRSVGWAPDRKKEATVGEKRTGTMVVIDQLVKYTPETDRYEGYAVLYNPLSMHVPHILSNGALAVPAGERRWTRAESMEQIPHIAGLASVAVTAEEALTQLLPVGAWVQLTYAEMLDKAIVEGGPLIHETKNWASLSFAGTGVAETGEREAFGKFDMLRRIPDRRKMAKEDEIKFRSSSFYDIPGAYRMISVYPHPELEEEIAQNLFGGKPVSRRERSAMLREALTSSNALYYRFAREMPVEELLGEKSTQGVETYMQTIPALRASLRMPPQRKVKRKEDGVFVDAPNQFSEFAAAYSTGSTAALMHEFAYFPHVGPYEEEGGRRTEHAWLDRDTDELLMVAVVADVKGSEKTTKKSSSVVYGFVPHSTAYDLPTSPQAPWVMYKPPILLTVPLLKDGALDPALEIEAGLGGPVVKGMSAELRTELVRLAAFLFTRFGVARRDAKDWENSYVADVLKRFKFKVDATHARQAILREVGGKLKDEIEAKRMTVRALNEGEVTGKDLDDAVQALEIAEAKRDKLYSEMRIEPEKGQQRVFIDVDGKMVWELFAEVHRREEPYKGYYSEATAAKQQIGPTDLDREWARVTSTMVRGPDVWNRTVETAAQAKAGTWTEARNAWARGE